MQNHKEIYLQRHNLFSRPYYQILIALILPLFILQGCSQNAEKDNESLSSSDLSAGPKLVVDTNTYDFGTIGAGDTKKGVFNLSNAGDKTLVIKQIDKCCGAVITIDQNEIEPGQSALLTAEYHASQGPGLFSKKITVHTNDPQNLEKTLTIKGMVMETLEWSPTDFEVATFKHTDIPDITIKSLNNKPFSIKNFASTNGSITADFDPNAKATEFTLKPEANLEKLKTIKAGSGNISILLDHPDYTVISLSFQLIKPLQASPSQIVVTGVKKGELLEKTIEIYDNAAPPDENIFEQIESITVPEGAKVEVLKHDALKNGCRILLKIQPSDNDAQQALSFIRDSLIIKMKDGSQLNVPLRIYYQ